ncbi:hypothetical protein Q7P37_006941 [Cladosporium fusiforme]
MANPAFRGARRLASSSSAMAFGRSNSLSINTGAANSTLYAPSPLSSSIPLQTSPAPPINAPKKIGLKAPVAANQCDVTNNEAPWLDPNWKPPPRPQRFTAEAMYDAELGREFSTTNKPSKSRRSRGGDFKTSKAERDMDPSEAPWLSGDWKPPPGPSMPESGPNEEQWPVGNPFFKFHRADLAGPGPRKMLTPRKSGSQQGGGLFGGGAATSQPQQAGGLFGGSTTQTSQPQTGGLFGGGGAQQNTSSSTGGLFGNTQQNTQQNAQTSTGGLFGNTQQNQTQQQTQQPAGGSLFGGASTTQNQQQPSTQQPAGGSLFGGLQSNTMNKPAAGTGSLFGNTTTQQPQQQQGGGLFGNTTTQQPASNSLFGGLNQSQSQPQQQQQQAGQTSLLGASRYNQSQYQPFVTGRLTMGQGGGAAPQPTATPATKLDWSNVRNTTRFNDLTDEAKQDIEKIDKMISEQEDLCKQIEAFLPNHQQSIETLSPDVQLITEKLDEVDRSLAIDAQGVQQDKNITEKDEIDIARCIRIVDNLRMPSQYVYHPAANSGRQPQPPAWDDTYDVDLVGNYFQPMTHDMAKLLATYSGNLAEIESHMGTIEQTAVAHAQQLHAQRSGASGHRDVSADSVRQLADTLRGFEASILAAAGKVGGCREGVNELALGRFGSSQASRRPW